MTGNEGVMLSQIKALSRKQAGWRSEAKYSGQEKKGGTADRKEAALTAMAAAAASPFFPRRDRTSGCSFQRMQIR